MFSLTTSPIIPSDLLSTIPESCGGVVTFEGRVRNHHQGREVLKLEYSAHPVLAESEGEQVMVDALARFPEVTLARAVHRHGTHNLGDIAVLVIVASSHRAEAFEACRWIIDEIKHRVPIWKNEFYRDGTSEWTGCEGCRHAH
ncbi:MAG: molybdenum cofactor biosynthesis protein MoaE [Verrucomicrobiota bacterium JB023]|nr:molybdenum cofactor biosynthesis protein MoaE [Verrucomicrobiota bacterium JB023]